MPQEKTWHCSCPDHSRRIHKLSNIGQMVSEYERAWDNSVAGAKNDCKHIMNAKIVREEQVGPFTDAVIDKVAYMPPSKSASNSKSFTFKSFKGFRL